MEQQRGVGSADKRYQFTGHEKDELTGLMYAGARTYLTEEGVWMQVDPLAGKYAGWSPYSYSANNPIIFYDPDGRQINIYVYNSTRHNVAVNDVATIVVNQFETEGVKVYTGIAGNFKFELKRLFGSENSIKVKLDLYASDGTGRGASIDKFTGDRNTVLVNLVGLQHDGETNLETAAANDASHEIGHNKADLQHPKDEQGREHDDGSIIGRKIKAGTIGDEIRQISPPDQEKLQERLNKRKNE